MTAIFTCFNFYCFLDTQGCGWSTLKTLQTIKLVTPPTLSSDITWLNQRNCEATYRTQLIPLLATSTMLLAKNNHPPKNNPMSAHLKLVMFLDQLLIHTAFGTEFSQSKSLAQDVIIVMLRLHFLLRHNLAHCCINTFFILKIVILFTGRQQSHGQHKTC